MQHDAIIGAFRDDEKSKIFGGRRSPKYNVKAIKIGEVGIFKWDGHSPKENFLKAIRQACYRAKPMKFRTATYDAYAPGAVAVERVL